MPDFRFTCDLEHGIHARPASVLAEAIKPFAAQALLIKEATQRSADLRSVLSIVALDVGLGDECTIRAEGSEADGAINALRLVIDEGFGSQDALGRQRLVEAINLVKDDFAKILVITHLDELKDAFPTRIEVEKTDRGSMVTVN